MFLLPALLAACIACFGWQPLVGKDGLPLVDKTLVVWAQPANLDQRGSGALSVLEDSSFDSIVLGEVRPGVWMPGSDHFDRTETNQAAWPAESSCEMVCVAIAYEGKKVRLFRNGALAAEYEIDAPRRFGDDTQFALGLRHSSRGFFAGEIEEARIYARALTAQEIAKLVPAAPGVDVFAQASKPLALWSFEDGTPREEMGVSGKCALRNGARIVDGRLVLDGVDDFLGTEVDLTSKVPRRDRYAVTLEEQLAELRDDPQLRRFAESRARNLEDPHHPIFHYVAPENRMNDPNGLCFWQGRWHLFYQGYPPEDPRQHWGHAVSDDLIHWRDLPYALYPNPERCCFSGAALVEEDRVIAMYHGTEVGNMVAISTDPLLLNWEKVTGQAVIPIASPDGSPLPYRVFDPCIWKKDGLYYSLSGGTLPVPGEKQVRANFLFRSKDLAHWEYLHPFAESDLYSLVGDDGACPYFWPLGARHILLHYSHMSGGKYLLGDYDQERDKMVVTDGGDFNHGPSGPGGVHAPSACPDGQGGVIAIFNMNPAKAAKGWNQIMTLPMRLTLAPPEEVDPLHIEPAGEVESLRGDHRRVEAMPLPANEEIVLEGIGGRSMEILAEIDPKSAPMIELKVLRSPDSEEFTRITFQKARGYRHREFGGKSAEKAKQVSSVLAIDNLRSSILPDVQSRAPEVAQFVLPPGEPLKLRIFVDRSVVEVFANGRKYVALRVYPGREDSLGVSLRAQGAEAVLKSLDAWQMKSIYEGPVAGREEA